MLNIPDAVKALYICDGRPDIRKTFRVHFPNGELPDIKGDQIVAESVQFTESVMSQSNFRFGLAEAPQISFETVGVGNMLGMTIECSHEIETTSLSAAQISAIQSGTWDGTLVLASDSDIGYGFFSIPLGTFTVDTCPRNHGAMTHRRVTAYGEIVNSEGGSFGYEYFKLRAWHKTSTYSLDVRSVLFATTGIDLFASTNIETTATATETNTFRLYQNITAGCAMDIWYGYHMTNLSSVNVVSFKLPEVIDTTARLDAFDTLWAPFEHYWTPEENETIRGLIETFWTNPTTALVLSDTDTYSGRYFSQPQYIIPPVNTGAKYAKGNATTVIRIPTSLTIDVHEGGNDYTLNIPIYGAGTPNVTTWKLVDVGDNVPIITLAPTATTTYSGTTYYAYSGSVSFDDLVIGALELAGEFGFNNRLGSGYDNMALNDTSPISIIPDEYTEMWYDEFDVSDIGSIIFDYTDSADGKQTVTYDLGNGGGSVYDMTGNYLVNVIPSTLQDAEDLIDTYFVPNIGGVDFTPIELTARGMPWIQAGDAVEVTTEDGEVVESFILERTLTGIQTLTDSIKSTSGTLLSVEAS